MPQWIVAGLPLAGWPHPLGAELVDAGTLASLGHRYLPPGIPRQFIAALLHGPALTVSQLVHSGSRGHTVKPAGTSRTERIPKAASPSQNDGDIPKASSAATHLAFRWPPAKACSSVSRANWLFDR